MSQLQNYFERNSGNAIHKWMHYFDIYDFWFRKFKNKPITIVEIGIFQGGSLAMWRDYFGSEARIIGIDINPQCKQFESEDIEVFIGSQADRDFLRFFKKQVPQIDILIDDGGHTMEQQIITFEELYNHISSEGIYLCEDLHTSYWKDYGGGYRSPESFIEYSKNFIDLINAWHSKEKDLIPTNFTRSTYGLHFYDSILVIEKKPMSPPRAEIRGTSTISAHGPIFSSSSFASRVRNRLTRKIIGWIRNL